MSPSTLVRDTGYCWRRGDVGFVWGLGGRMRSGGFGGVGWLKARPRVARLVVSALMVSAGLTALVGSAGASSVSAQTGWTKNKLFPPAAAGMRGVSCPTTLVCEAVGSGSSSGAVMATTDGGTKWHRQTIPSGVYLSGISCVSTSQ